MATRSVAAALPRMGGLEVVAGALSEPVSKFGLFLLVSVFFMWPWRGQAQRGRWFCIQSAFASKVVAK